MEFDRIITDDNLTVDKLLQYKMSYSEAVARQINNITKVCPTLKETLLTITELSIQLGIIESAISVMAEEI